MAKSSSAVWLAAAAAVCFLAVALAPRAEAAITCVQVTGSLGQCLGYLKGTVGAPPAACCAGVRNLNSMAQTTPDRQAACGCLKNTARSLSGLNTANAAALPGVCGVKIPYAISLSTNCNNVK